MVLRRTAAAIVSLALVGPTAGIADAQVFDEGGPSKKEYALPTAPARELSEHDGEGEPTFGAGITAETGDGGSSDGEGAGAVPGGPGGDDGDGSSAGGGENSTSSPDGSPQGGGSVAAPVGNSPTAQVLAEDPDSGWLVPVAILLVLTLGIVGGIAVRRSRREPGAY